MMFLNHSCEPNVKFFDGKHYMFYAKVLTDIEEGEELTVNYLNALSELGFKCNCPKCSKSEVK